MKNYTFSSVLKFEMVEFVQLRLSQGLRDYTKLYILESLMVGSPNAAKKCT